MTNAHKASVILKLVSFEVDKARGKAHAASARHAAETAGAKERNRIHMEENGGIGPDFGNSYHPDRTEKEIPKAVEEFLAWKEIHEYATETFLNKIV